MDDSRKMKVTNKSMDTFAITWKDPETDVLMFFAGWFNEVEDVGSTENECQCWGQEEWVDDLEVGVKFNSYRDAKDALDQMDTDKTEFCSIVLYGKGAKMGADDSYWFPLKIYHQGRKVEQ